MHIQSRAPPDCAEARAIIRPSARPHVSVHDRNVGALFLLRHALAARALHDEISAAVRSFQQCDRACRAQARTRRPVRPARRAAVVVADLGPLYRARLFHADLRRAPRRPRARPAPHRRHRRDADGDRPFHDGGRTAFSVRALSRSFSAVAASSRIFRRRSAAFMRRAMRAATAPIPFSMSASISARSWRRSSAAHWAKASAGITALPPPASAW